MRQLIALILSRSVERVVAGAVFSISLLAAVSGQARPLDPLTPEEIVKRLDGLTHTRWDGQANEEFLDYVRGCIYTKVNLKVVDPVNQGMRELHLEVVRPNVTRPVPAVVLVPTIEGVTILEPTVASHLCDAKIATVIADVNDNRQPGDLPAWGHEDLIDRSSIIALRTVIDYVEHNPIFDPSKIGMMGLSLGGITTSMMAGIEAERLKAFVIAVGGSNLPYILTHSSNKKVKLLRERRMKQLGWTSLEFYEDELRQSILFDPYYFAPHVKTEKVMMIMAQSDDKVPYLVQQEQFEAFGKPHSMLFKGGHVGSLARLAFFFMRDVVDFFESRFKGSQFIEHKTIDLGEVE